MLEISLKLMFLNTVNCCFVAHQEKVRALLPLYLLVMNDLWFGSWIRVASRAFFGKAGASNAIDILEGVVGSAVPSTFLS